MPNKPAENTIATSFTLPRGLFSALKRRAKIEMTNQSDIVRRALMNYLPAQDREMVLRELDGHAETEPRSGTNVHYKIETGRKKPGASSKVASAGTKALEQGAAGARKSRQG